MMRFRIWSLLMIGCILLPVLGCGRQDLYSFPDSPYPLVGQLDLPSANEGVAVLGHYAFVAGGEAGLHVIDISDPSHPELKATLNTTKYAESIEVVRTFHDGRIVDIAHVVEGTEGVTSYDVSDPLHPVDLQQGTTAVDGNRMALAPAADPSDPYLLFLAENWKGVRVFESNAFVPGVLDYNGVFAGTLGYAKGLAFNDPWLYVADDEMGLVVMDASLLILGSFGVAASADTPGNALDVAVDGDFAYVADGVMGIEIFDISTPDQPVLASGLDLPAYSRAIAVRDGLAFLAAATGGVHIVDVSDPYDPVYAGNVPSGYAADLALGEDGLVLVADYEDGLLVLQGDAFADRVAPAPVQDLAGEPYDFTSVTLSWIATGDDGLQGRADHYEVRRADAPIANEGDWQAASVVGGTPDPSPAGALETMRAGAFMPGQSAYFSVRALDESGHLSALSSGALAVSYTGTVLKDARVTPREGSFQEPFVFEVVYLDEFAREPSVQHDLELDGEPVPMEAVEGDFYRGELYRASVTLVAGEHSFRFLFDNGLPDGRVETALDSDLFATLGVTYTMGSPLDEPGRDADEVRTQVSILENLEIAEHEVSQAEWTQLMGDNPSEYVGEDLPVQNVSWYDAVRYCNARSQDEALTAAYTIDGGSVSWNRDANGWRLPTEAEWEYFARGGAQTAFCGGEITVTGFDIDPVLDIYGWYGGNADPARPQSVETKAANDFGLYDMHGNVAEWCWDWYAPYPPGPLLDPAGPDEGDFKVIRGGDWFYEAKACRSASRETFPPSSADSRVGFRIIRTLIDE